MRCDIQINNNIPKYVKLSEISIKERFKFFLCILFVKTIFLNDREEA